MEAIGRHRQRLEDKGGVGRHRQRLKRKGDGGEAEAAVGRGGEAQEAVGRDVRRRGGTGSGWKGKEA